MGLLASASQLSVGFMLFFSETRVLLFYKKTRKRVLVFLLSLPCLSAEVTPARLGYFCFPEVTNPNAAEHVQTDR